MVKMNMKKIEELKLEKLEFRNCFFCNKILITNLDISNTREYGESLRNIFGDFTKISGHAGQKIGNKFICDDCKNDIWAMAQDEFY